MHRKINGSYYALRFAVLKKDNFTCQYCGQYAPNVMLEIDHIIPVEDGGKDEMTNLKTTCAACNRGRSGLRIAVQRGTGLKIAAIYENHNTLPNNSVPTINRQDKAISLLKDHPEGLNEKEIAEGLNITISYSHILVARLRTKKRIIKQSPITRPLKFILTP